MRENGDSGYNSGGGNTEKGFCSRLTGLADGLNAECALKKRVKSNA